MQERAESRLLLSVISREEAEELAARKQAQGESKQDATKEQAKNSEQKPEAKLKGVESRQAKEAVFLTFHERDGVVGNFLKNLLAQYNALHRDYFHYCSCVVTNLMWPSSSSSSCST